jgi:hypothetical protein
MPKVDLKMFKMPLLTQTIMALAVLLEALWVYTWVIWVSQWPSLNWLSTPFNFVSCLAQALFTGILTRIALREEWSPQKIRWVVLPSSLLFLLFLVRLNNGGGYGLWDGRWAAFANSHVPQLLSAFFLGIYFSWRGIASNRQGLSFSDLYRRFTIGVAALVILIVIWGLPKGGMRSSWSEIGAYLVLFFGVGLLSLALANLESLRNEFSKHQEASTAFSRRWISILLILVIAILGISVAVMGIFSSGFVGTLLHGLGVAANWLITGVAYLLYPVGLLVAGLYYVIQWLVNWLRGGAQPPKFVVPDFSDLQKQAEGQPTAHVPVILLFVLKWGLLLLLVAFLIFLLSRALVRFWQGKDLENLEEEHETFFSWTLLRADLGGFFGWLFRWIRWKNRADAGARSISSGKASMGDAGRELNVRELYRAVLSEGNQIGSPRKSFETAYEYEKRLETLIPDIRPELKTITESYIIERYGDGNEPPEKVSLLNRLWRNLRLKLAPKV